MKFVVDAQLPRSLSEFLKYKGFDAIHTLDLPEKNGTIKNTIIIELGLIVYSEKDMQNREVDITSFGKIF